MFNREAVKRRLSEIVDEVDRKNADFKAGKISDEKYFRKFLDGADAESKELYAALKAYERSARYAGGTEVATGGVVGGMPGVAAPGQTNQCLQSPMQLAPDQVNALVRAFETKTPLTLQVQTKGGWQSGVEFKSPVAESGLATALPGVEMPNLYMGFPYEPSRLAAYLPGAAMSGPSAYWLSETAHANEAAIVPENTAKPDLGPTLVNNEVVPMKIAGQFSVTLEMWQDYVGDIGGWLLQSLQRSIINRENSALLNAVQGTAGATFNGFLNVSGTLSQSASGMNGVDAIITAAAAMRSNSNGFASPDLLIASPNTVAQILMEKDGQGRYLNNIVYGGGPGGLTWNGGAAVHETTSTLAGGFVPQGTNGGDLTLAGVPVVQTTEISDGTAVMLSVRNGGGVYWTRLNMLIFFDPYTGLTNNTFRWVAENRVALSVPRPAAVSVISNLPA